MLVDHRECVVERKDMMGGVKGPGLNGAGVKNMPECGGGGSGRRCLDF